MSWNYRIFKSYYPGIEDEHCLDIREVYYFEDGTISSWTKEGVSAFGDTLEELRDDLWMMLRAFEFPTLDEKELEAEIKQEEH